MFDLSAMIAEQRAVIDFDGLLPHIVCCIDEVDCIVSKIKLLFRFQRRIYLVCFSKMLLFYTNLGFVALFRLF